MASTSEAVPSWDRASLLGVDVRKLHPESELRRIFGSRIVDSESREAVGTSSADLPIWACPACRAFQSLAVQVDVCVLKRNVQRLASQQKLSLIC